jgi:signal peptidase I
MTPVSRSSTHPIDMPPRPGVTDGTDGSTDELPPDHLGAPSRRHLRRRALEWCVVVTVALMAAFLVRTFVVAHFVVDGQSMASTLADGDRVLVNKLSYRLHDPQRGDVVVLHDSGGTDRDLIKRVIALEGETIEMRNCQVRVDGTVLVEPYLDRQVVGADECGPDVPPTIVPADHVYVMGDNRAHSQDSRALGPIDQRRIVGRAEVVFWPLGQWRWL